MKLLILGGTGATGKHLVTQALAAGDHVRAIVRDPARMAVSNPSLEVVKADVTSASELAGALDGRNAVVSALGPRKNADPICAHVAKPLVEAMNRAGVKRLVWLSAGGVGDSAVGITKGSFVFGRIIMPLFLRKPYANHLVAEEIFRASDLEWTVVRPVQLVDEPTGRTPAACAPDEKPGALKIARADVAAFMLNDLKTREQVGKMPILF